MFGYPHRVDIMIDGGEEECNAALQDLRDDWELFYELAAEGESFEGNGGVYSAQFVQQGHQPTTC